MGRKIKIFPDFDLTETIVPTFQEGGDVEGSDRHIVEIFSWVRVKGTDGDWYLVKVAQKEEDLVSKRDTTKMSCLREFIKNTYKVSMLYIINGPCDAVYGRVLPYNHDPSQISEKDRLLKYYGEED